MSGFEFSESARQALSAARREAARRGAPVVGPEHLLLGVLGQESSLAAAALAALGLDPAALRQRLDQQLPAGREQASDTVADLPFSHASKRVLEAAMAIAQELRHLYVGGEHLLLGVLAEQENQVLAVAADRPSLGADVLRDNAVTLAALRRIVARLVEEADPDAVLVPAESPLTQLQTWWRRARGR